MDHRTNLICVNFPCVDQRLLNLPEAIDACEKNSHKTFVNDPLAGLHNQAPPATSKKHTPSRTSRDKFCNALLRSPAWAGSRSTRSATFSSSAAAMATTGTRAANRMIFSNTFDPSHTVHRYSIAQNYLCAVVEGDECCPSLPFLPIYHSSFCIPLAGIWKGNVVASSEGRNADRIMPVYAPGCPTPWARVSVGSLVSLVKIRKRNVW